MENILTIEQAGWLADLIRGVESNSNLRWYPIGADGSAPNSTRVLRAFTNADGSLYSHQADIRDAHVWTSGIFEMFIPVRDVMAALANAINGSNLSMPMAMIEPR